MTEPLSEQEYSDFLRQLADHLFRTQSEAAYPVPDPDWDYANAYHRMQQAKSELEAAIARISELEEASEESDDRLEAQLSEIRELLRWRSPGGNRYRVG